MSRESSGITRCSECQRTGRQGKPEVLEARQQRVNVNQSLSRVSSFTSPPTTTTSPPPSTTVFSSQHQIRPPRLHQCSPLIRDAYAVLWRSGLVSTMGGDRDRGRRPTQGRPAWHVDPSPQHQFSTARRTCCSVDHPTGSRGARAPTLIIKTVVSVWVSAWSPVLRPRYETASHRSAKT